MKEVLASLGSLYFFRRPLLWGLCLYIFILLLLRQAGILLSPHDNDPGRWAGERVLLTGVISQHPDPRPDANVFVLEAETLRPFNDPERRTFSVRGLTQIWAKGMDADALFPGDRVSVAGRLQKPGGRVLPGGFDYREFLAVRGIHSVIYTSLRQVDNLGPAPRFAWLRKGWTLKLRFHEIFSRGLSNEHAAVLSGLFMGLRPRFHPEIKKMFIESGTMHVLVASGSNVAFLLGLWILAARIVFRLPNAASFALGLPLVWLYAVLVGNDPPIFRAALMATVGVMAYFLRRDDHPFHAWTLAAWAALLINPSDLFDVGFQMSFITVAGLLYWLPLIGPSLSRLPFLVRWPLGILAATMTAQIWIWPVTARVFLRWYPAGLPANLAVVPLSAFGIGGGLGFLAAEGSRALGIPLIWPAAAATMTAYLDLLLFLVKFFSRFPGWVVWTTGLSPLGVAIYYSLCLLAPELKRTWVRRAAMMLMVCVLLSAAASKASSLVQGNKWTAEWVDHGRGVTFLLRNNKGDAWVASPAFSDTDQSVEKRLLPFLLHRGVKRVPVVIHHRLKEMDPSQVDLFMSAFPGARFMRIDSVSSQGIIFEEEEKLEAEPVSITRLPGSQMEQSYGNLLFEIGDAIFFIGETWLSRSQKAVEHIQLKKMTAFQGRFYGEWRWDKRWKGLAAPMLLVESRSRPKDVSPPEFSNTAPVRLIHEEGVITWPIPSQPKRSGETIFSFGKKESE